MPYGQSFSHICQIGDHHVSLWMMPHKGFEHCSRLQIDFCFWLHCLKTIPKFFYLGFHNIFIVHGVGHGKHLDVGCTMAGLCGSKSYPNCLCTWHVLKAWRLCSMEKIKDLKVRLAILDHVHMMMFMSINLDETIDVFKACGKRWWWKVLIIYNLVCFGQDIFGLIIVNSISKGSPFQVWHN